MAAVISHVRELTASWKGKIDFKVDDRNQYRPGFKFNEWEKRGVPIRIEIGPKDIENKQAVIVRRDTGEKISIAQDQVLQVVLQKLQEMQEALFKARTRASRDL